MIIIGIDPGVARMGYGVIKKIRKRKRKNQDLRCLDFGCIETKKELEISKRFLILSKEIRKLAKKYQPHLVAIESLFFFQNKKTVIKVSQATGAALLTLGRIKVPVVEFSPQEVKKTLTNNGRANKNEIQKRVRRILRLKQPIKPDDAADALAIAICAADKLKE